MGLTVHALLLALLVTLGASCGDGSSQQGGIEPLTTEVTRLTTSSAGSESPDPTDLEGTQTVTPSSAEPLYESGDIDRGLQPFIDQAKDDLAQRLNIDAQRISTHAAVLTVWPDASLGCPQPDMFYAQVLTGGSIIELMYDGAIYRYHTGGTQGPFICEQPVTQSPKATPLTLDTGGSVDN